MKLGATGRTTRGWLVAACLGPLALGGCNEGSGDGGDEPPGLGSDSGDPDDPGDSGGPGSAPLSGPDECVDTRSYFEEMVWRPVLQTKCYACHSQNGAARDTDFVLRGGEDPGYLEANYNTLLNISRLEVGGESLVLLKPTEGVQHGGGKQLDPTSSEYDALAEIVARFDAPAHCVDDKDIEAYFEGIVNADPQETLRKATFLLASRMPTPGEYDQVEDGGVEVLDELVDALTHEDAFYDRLAEIYNDQLHTDAYLLENGALALVDPERFPNGTAAVPGPDQMAWANEAIAREPLNLIEYVVRNDRPFTEVLTADYTIVTPYSARVYGIGMELFANPDDPNELAPYTFEDAPQSGIMTSVAYLNRYPNTPTNRNRHRSRMVFDHFLGEDVERLAARPIEIDSVQATNPTLFDNSCRVCHEYIDPLAGSFTNWSDEGFYRPRADGWYADMVPPGFGNDDIPNEEMDGAVPWLAQQIVDDPRFSLSVVYTMYSGLTGAKPLVEPSDPESPDYVQQIRAFEAQDWTFQGIANRFENSNYDLRVVVRELVKTPWFRAVSIEGEMNEAREAELQAMGSSRVLPPEALDRKIVAALGFQWMRDGAPALTDGENYHYFFGGTDSKYVTSRLDQVNGVMANIVQRMANEMACQATAWDFARPANVRLLFPHVELNAMPADNEEAIRNNIKYLHKHLLGEVLEDDDFELERTYRLFEAVLELGQREMGTEEYPVALPGMCQALVDRQTGEALTSPVTDDPNYTVRAWMAVVSYMLGDYRFIYE